MGSAANANVMNVDNSIAARTPLGLVLLATFWGSVSGGTFWSSIFFVTSKLYKFSAFENLALAALMGFGYAVSAWTAGPCVRLLQRWISVRAVMMLGFALWGLAALLPLLRPLSQPLFWFSALVGTAASALVWPVMESFMSAGRHGAGMRGAIGWYNLSWTLAVAISLLIVPALVSLHVLAPVASCAAFNLVALAAVAAFPANPSHHDPELSRQSVGAQYPMLRQATLWMLPLSYVMAAIISPVLPSRLALMGVSASAAPVWASTWMLARVVALVLLWRTSFWHGRWGTILAGGVLLLVGVLAALLAPTVYLLAAGLAVFGTGMAVVYYQSLYYGLAVGGAQVDAGGTFEGLVGLGYFIGPTLGLVGFGLGGDIYAERLTLALTWLLAFVALIGPAKAYRHRPRNAA